MHQLDLVGSWQLSPHLLKTLPQNIRWRGPVSAGELRERYRDSDIFVFPSYFEGYGLVLLESLACGLPYLATEATAAADFPLDIAGQLFASGDSDQLVNSLRWYSTRRDDLPAMSILARQTAEDRSWDNYRARIRESLAYHS